MFVFVRLSDDLGKQATERTFFTGSDVTGAASLTLSAALSGRVVEGKAQGDQRSDLQDDERDILQGLPYQLQESFWLLWRYQVFPKYFSSLVQIRLGTCETWERKTGKRIRVLLIA